MEELLKRLKSFAWRLLGMSLAAGLAFVSSNLDLLDSIALSPELKGLIVMIAGLVIGECTKWINRAFALEEQIGAAVRKLRGK